jgi:hypothetical protein
VYVGAPENGTRSTSANQGGDSGPSTPRTARVAPGNTVFDVTNRRLARMPVASVEKRADIQAFEHVLQ